jgi:hypothetical protein
LGGGRDFVNEARENTLNSKSLLPRRAPARRRLALALAGVLSLGAILAGVAIAKVNRYPVDAVTIKADAQTHRLSGKIVADSVTEHFCTLGTWPLNVFRARAGKDKKVAHLNTGSQWKFKVPRQLRGTRLYAEVPSYPVHEHGYCVGARSRTVRAR